MICILVFFSILVLASIVLQHPAIQTHITRNVSNQLSSNLGAKITIEKVSITFINRLQLKKLYIEDQGRDTLLYADRVTASLRSVSQKKKQITIKNLSFHDAFINFKTDSTGEINLKFIIEFLKNPDKQKNKDYMQ